MTATQSLSSSLTARASASPGARAKTDKVRIDVYRSWDSAAKLMPIWEQILTENKELTIFCTPEWLKSWWDAFGSQIRLCILAFVGDGDRVLGIAPLYIETVDHALLGSMRQIRFVGDGSGDSDNLDLVTRVGTEGACIDAMLNWIVRNGCSLCAFNTLDATSSSAQILAQRLSAGEWVLQHTATPSSHVDFPQTWKEYFESLSSGFRKLLRQSARGLNSAYRVNLRRCERPDEIPGMLNDLFRLHQKRWAQIGEPGSFTSAERRTFYAKMAAAFLERGWLELWSLDLNGKSAAAQISFRYRDTVYGLQEGFDPALRKLHPGYALRAGMFESLVARHIKKYSFLGGFSAAKGRWGAKCGEYANFTFAIPQTRGAYHIALDRSAAASKEWLRQHLPAQMWEVLHRIKMNYQDRNRAAVPEIGCSEEGLAS